MSAETETIGALIADAGVGAICGDRIRPIKLSQNEILPAISLQRITADHGGSLGGDTSNCTRVYLQIDCWAKTYGETKALAAAVRTAMKTIKSMPIDSTDFYEDDTDTHRVSFDFYVWE